MSPPPSLPPPPPLSDRAAKWVFVIACVAWAMLQTHGFTPETQSTPPGASTSLAPDVVNIEAQSFSRIDLTFDRDKPISPENPWVVGQQHRPCTPDLMVEIFALCWFQHGGPLGPSRARCPAGTMTYAGACYFPVTARRPGVSDPLPTTDGGTWR